MPSIMPKPQTESEGNSYALTCLNEVIDSSRIPRKSIADDLGKSEATLSKMTSGMQAFGLDDFGRLPRNVQQQFVKRYGKLLGLNVTEIDAAQLTQEIFEGFGHLTKLLELVRVVGRPQMAHAELTERSERRTG